MSNFKSALITGASSGIGAAIAIELARNNYQVALLGRRAHELQAVSEHINETGGLSVFFECDVSDQDSTKVITAKILSDFGSIDALICNAGINNDRNSIIDSDLESWKQIIDINFFGSLNMIRNVLPHMINQKRGTIIQICSLCGKRPSARAGSGYSVSKSAQSSLGICIGREVNNYGIRSSTIYPGEVNTELVRKVKTNYSKEKLNSILQPQDIATAVKFILSLPDRVNIAEMIIKPSSVDYA